MGNLIRVSAQSRTKNINFVVQGEIGSATYDLAQVYKNNQYLPERKAPESNLAIIKQAIVVPHFLFLQTSICTLIWVVEQISRLCMD